MKTQVAIIGAGPAGLLLSQLLHRVGIATVVLERQSRAHVEGRIRAGVLEQGTVDVLTRAGVGDRLNAQGLRHAGVALSARGRRCRIALDALTGSSVTVYGQTEITKDLMRARIDAGGRILFEVGDVAVHDVDADAPFVTCLQGERRLRIDCDFVAGCDGFHGVSRGAIPAGVRQEFQREYPFGWLGILADVPPCDHELIYAHSERGFALASMRSLTRSRYYIQCAADEKLEQWPDERLWGELERRLGPEAAATMTTGPAIEKSIAPLRSFVCEPMRHGRLFLAGDAAHIVPPTGAKGLNLAVGDVHYLSTAFDAHYNAGSESGLRRYSEVSLRRVWKAERFSWMLTSMLHDFGGDDGFGRRIQLAELEYIFSSRAAQIAIAENYVGLPFEDVLG
jgi:p-hydroxybenzoate 3-monooxygenase